MFVQGIFLFSQIYDGTREKRIMAKVTANGNRAKYDQQSTFTELFQTFVLLAGKSK